MKIPRTGGGWHAISYTFRQSFASGGTLKMWSAMRAKNACKTCALGMGGQMGGMVNEKGHFPEFCKKSIQAMASDLQPAIPLANITTVPFDYLAGLSPRQLETMGRITVPMVAERGADHYRAATWDEAMQRLGAHLKTTPPERSFFYFSGRASNEAAFLLQLFARLYGTNNVNNCSFYCHQASGVGLTSVLGQSTGTMGLDDLDHSDLVFLIGGNPASNHPRFMRTLMQVRRRGGQVIVVNPLRETGLVNFSVPSDPRSLVFGTTIADLYLQPHIGGDIALFTAMAKRLLDGGGVDRAWLAEHANGWDELERHLAAQDLDDLVRTSGVPLAQIDDAVARYRAAKAAVFSWTMGITHHRHGVDNVRAIAALALMRGMCGFPGAGLLPLRGHSNVQGIGTVGVTPKLKDEVFARLQDHLGVRLPTAPGMDTMACMERATAGGIGAAWCLGGNLFGSNPDAAYATKALAGIDQIVYLNTTLNTGHVHGLGKETWVLPVLARDEEPQPTTQESMFSFVRLSDGGAARHEGPRSEVRIVGDLGRAVLGDGGAIDWAAMGASHGRVREAIAACVPGLEPLADIDRTKQEFQIAGRDLVEPKFKTPDGKARLAVAPVPRETPLGERELRLMTIRSEGQFNSVVYEDHDRYRGTERRDVILLAPEDRARLGLVVDQQVVVRSAVGEMRVRVREFAIRAGNAAMYYPEANVLVPRDLDPESRTPSFKNVRVAIG